MKAIANLTCKEIATIVGGEIIGNPEVLLHGLNRIEYAHEGELTFLANPKYEKFLKTTEASCILVPETLKVQPNDKMCFIKSGNPYTSFVKILQLLESKKQKKHSLIHPSAIIAESAQVAANAYIGPYCVVGENCVIGENSSLDSHVVLYDNVSIAKNTVIKARVVCFDNTVIGSNCIIHSGAVIGDDGFGYIENKDGSYEKIPQLGNVIIKDDVEIGSNTTIDRAMSGSTIIEKGVIIDNLVQIGHNVHVGEHTAMAAQVGIAGSCKIGKRNRFGGQVGLGGHLDTVDDVILVAQSGVAKSVQEKGIYFGTPIKDKIKAFKIESALLDLPDVIKDFHRLKKIIMDKFNLHDLKD